MTALETLVGVIRDAIATEKIGPRGLKRRGAGLVPASKRVCSGSVTAGEDMETFPSESEDGDNDSDGVEEVVEGQAN